MRDAITETEKFRFFSASVTTALELVVIPGLAAGFPSPAADFIDLTIDLNKELIKNPSSTFLARIEGDSMSDINICNGDIVVIDKSLDATEGKIIVAFLNGAFTVKRIQFEKKGCWLVAENPKYPAIRVTEESDFQIWGVVVHVIKSF
ncbi:LexA family protein [Dyadobacter psychrotolerans]|uniref:Translesion error-prone DNA polymerase V autoproteolytic subunit n=1 Tax=Dyadobacter psychrotolerans TaxID=2541721 RepID=A0A4R5DJP3_9BACT|nr:translesion error-prone DNA polymerase V autoproteolytic subunit [Dyadobacter psychrotolerans]TDE10803.1 translesion error-prone DNA polymerase V autoproteolytic subunit [Dyadobacter psychrotolerans]